tara:strand:+ start:476 stop:721 length:246 start_codon:yes stop_codon:yes gene_type:complete
MTPTSNIIRGDIIEYRRGRGLLVMEVCDVRIWDSNQTVELTGHINTNDFGAEIAQYGRERDSDKVILPIEDLVTVTHHFDF